MDVTQFWQLIEKTRIENDRHGEQQAKLILEELMQLPLQEIIDYELIFRDFYDRAERYDLMDAAYFIVSFGDSGWKDFRGWLIGQGQKTYEMVLADPDTLAEIIPIEKRFEISGEVVLYTGQQAYALRMGDEDAFIPYNTDETYEASDRGESLDKDFTTWKDYDRRFAEKFPRVWEKFHDEMDENN